MTGDSATNPELVEQPAVFDETEYERSWRPVLKLILGSHQDPRHWGHHGTELNGLSPYPGETLSLLRQNAWFAITEAEARRERRLTEAHWDSIEVERRIMRRVLEEHLLRRPPGVLRALTKWPSKLQSIHRALERIEDAQQLRNRHRR